jgi:ATP-dependent DNA helicase RecQ
MAPTPEALRQAIEKYWGFRDFRPLQIEAMTAELEGRDSVVVMPTGGGKSLCYQAPAVLREGATVVVSPLIALMKDQVDGLRACGIPATQIDSSMSSAERAGCEFDLMNGEIKLLFVSPERLVMNDFVRLLQRAQIKTFAIDEAHCISHWGHDFRPEYRQLGRLKELFPGAAIHAYTATATEIVRKDICTQANLRSPLVLVGNFDRPNLNFRVLARTDLRKQILEVVNRHAGEAGIIYCLRRQDVEDVNAFLQDKGVKSLPYHAGLEKEDRRRTQDDFAEERCDLIVATVAFGMGIDRSNVRYILHTGMPKSIEHYQQETGRAGRDGLEAECVLLHSGSDVVTWKRIMQKSATEANAGPDFLANANRHIEDMDKYARGATCRHQALVNYFGQKYEAENCGACDMCLGDNELVADAVVVAQKILSCVARVQERFGINHVISVLRGEASERIQSYQHDKLSTYGLLKDHAKTDIREWIYQLIGQKVLVQTSDEYPVLRLNDASREVFRKERTVKLLQPVRKAKEKVEKSKAEVASWEGVDRELFEALRARRHELATQRQVPPYVIFSDATLRQLARVRPSSLDKMRLVYGIGEKKLADLGQEFLHIILDHCRLKEAPLDQDPGLPQTRTTPVRSRAQEDDDEPSKPVSSKLPDAQKRLALTLFEQRSSIDEVVQQTQRATSTVSNYLAEYIRDTVPPEIDAWVPRKSYDRVVAAIAEVGADWLKPIFVKLGETVPYEEIRLVIAHRRAIAEREKPV